VDASTTELKGIVNGVRVKICGLTRRADAVAAFEAGADLLGAVAVPSSPRGLSAADVPEILGGLPLPRVLVVADLDAEDAVEAAYMAGASVVQLHGNESPETAARIRSAGSWRVWKAFRVLDPGKAREDIARFVTAVDGILLDSWHPGRLGGTGKTFSWKEMRRVREAFPEGVEVILAGGLQPENVTEAIAELRPDIVDVSSGVESGPGLKDRHRIREFVAVVRRAKTARGRGHS
jgi:phosphoribosylanthranilate isomerase